MNNLISVISFFLFIVLANILVSFLDYKFDLTQDKKHSISNETQQILSEIDDVVFIKIYLDGI